MASGLKAVGSCPPSVLAASNTSSPTVHACVVASHKSCGPDSVCVGQPPAGALGPCIEAAGDKVCPVNYPKKKLAFDSFVDSRECQKGSCACTPSIGSCVVNGSPSGVQVGVGGCSAGTGVYLSFGASCTGIAGSGTNQVTLGLTLLGASFNPGTAGPCTATGAPSIVGDASGENPVTLCCQ